MSSTVVLRDSEKNQEIQRWLDKKAARNNFIKSVVPFTGLLFLFFFFWIVTGGATVAPSNLANLIDQCFTLAIIAVGATLVYAHGDKDFSIGAASGVAQLVGSLMIVNLGMPTWVVVVSVIAITLFCSTLVAGISQGLGVPVFVASICVRSICRGILGTTLQDVDIVFSYKMYQIFNTTIVKAAVLIAVLLVGSYLFNCTKIGRYQKAIGGNKETARQAGIKVKKEILVSYLFMGLCVGIASVFMLFRNSNVTAQSGSGTEFNIMIALALGGFPMSGGEESRIRSAIMGVVTLTLLSNGLTIYGVDPNLINGIKGLLFLIIVGMSYDKTSGKYVN